MKRSVVTAVLLLMAMAWQVSAQDEYSFYSLDSVQDIRLTFHVRSWKHYLDSIFTASGGEDRAMADITINGQTLTGVGVRYKGFSSVDLDDVKNPFNIDLHYTRKNKNYGGFTSLKLGNVNFDPSFVREALSYVIARKYMPAPHANFARVWVNDTLIGLYSNVEAVNTKFIIHYFPTKDNTLVKGKPEPLQYPFGQNSNLAYTHGDDSLNYMPYYEMESDYGWSDLFSFIRTLNEEPDSIPGILDVDRALWMHAFNYALLNLDSYIAYSQNYYLYKDDNMRFNTIPWDLNMSFGSFRESDGSTHFRGLTIPETEQLDPLGIMSYAVSPRPLMTKLFADETYRKMYLAHMRTIMNENFRNNEYYNTGKYIQDVIAASVERDTNKFYPYSWFRINLDTTVGNQGSTDEFPGIRELTQARTAYLDTYAGFTGEPLISGISHSPEFPVKGQQAWISARVTGASKVILGFRFRKADRFIQTTMYDDGSHEDGAAGDSIYGAGIIPGGPTIQYYIWAENDSAGAFSPERAEYGSYSIQPVFSPGDFTINELMPAGSSDPSGTSAPWIEFLNNTSEYINIGQTYLSDDRENLKKWTCPDSLISPKTYFIIWAGSPPAGDNLYCNFSLSPSGGLLYLSGQDGKLMDSVFYPAVPDQRSVGRYPNGWGTYTLMSPTFSAMNLCGTTPGAGILLYPNPARDVIRLEFASMNNPFRIEISNTCGQLVRRIEVSPPAGSIPVSDEDIDIPGLGQGLYYLRLTCSDQVFVKSFIVN